MVRYMKSNNSLPKDIVEGKLDKLEFSISSVMIERFIQLTSDHNSLHTDKAFGRRSMYRENVVHGILPITFISALKLWNTMEHEWYFEEIAARFVRPILENDKVLISSRISQIDEEEKRIKMEYALTKSNSEMILTTGNINLRYDRSERNRGKMVPPNLSDVKRSSMVKDVLVEQEFQFDQISKGDERKLRFMISKHHAHSVYEMLSEGLLSDWHFSLAEWLNKCDVTNLLSTCLFSTLVGMCMPGKYAIFTGFRGMFSKPIQWDKEYVMTGRVEFKSLSTFTIVENVLIHDTKNKEEPYATGQINASVSEPPGKMPSIELLENSEMELQLRDKVVLITGASRGIGETAAKLFSLYGSKVVINYFQGKEDASRIVNEIIAHGGSAIAIQADVSDRQQVNRMIAEACEEYRMIDILVNNAVRDFYPMPFMELIWDDVQRDIDVTVKGAFHCCQEVLPLMVKRKSGKIVNMSTVVAEYPVANQAKYVVSKSGLVGLTRSLAVEFAQDNIQVNMVVPSIVETDLTKCVPKIFLEGVKNDTPMNANATPIDVAKAVIYLSSDLSSFTTGQKVMVTGGNPPFL